MLLGVGGNANWPANPNLFSDFLTVSYNASTMQFTVSGLTPSYVDPTGNAAYGGPDYPDFVVDDYDMANPGTFSLSATVNNSGSLVSGTVAIGCAAGVYDPNYEAQLDGPGILLEGNLTAFGYRDGSDYSRFDFEFTVTGGELANDYGGIGATAGTALDTADLSFPGSFTGNFNSNGQGDADTLMMVPEPEPQILVILSLLGLCGVARRRATMRKA